MKKTNPLQIRVLPKRAALWLDKESFFYLTQSGDKTILRSGDYSNNEEPCRLDRRYGNRIGEDYRGGFRICRTTRNDR